MKNLFRANNIPALIVCIVHMTVIYFVSLYISQEPVISILTAIGIYAVIIAVAVSPVGEFLFRVCCGGRKIRVNEWQTKVNSALRNVILNTERNNICVPNNIRVYYVYDAFPTSFSVGRSVCLSSALLDSSQQNIEACIAHELGHITAYDSVITALANAGNIVVLALGALLQSFYTFNNWTSRYSRSRSSDIRHLLAALLLGLPLIIVGIVLGVTRLVLNIGNRGKEYAADSFAVNIGYGQALKNALLIMDFDSQLNRRNLWRSIVASHPGVYDRVGRIDNLMNDNSNHIYSNSQLLDELSE